MKKLFYLFALMLLFIMPNAVDTSGYESREKAFVAGALSWMIFALFYVVGSKKLSAKGKVRRCI